MGFAADRFGVRRIAILGIAVTGVAVLVASRTIHLWQLYTLFFLAGIFGGGAISAPLMALVGSWFPRRAGLAIGIAAAAQALGQGGMPFSGAFLIETLGWRGSLATQGMLILVIGLPLAWFLRAPPASKSGPAQLAQESGLTPTDAGSVLFLMLVVAIAGRAAFGHIADKIGALPTWILASGWQTLLVFGFTMIDGLTGFYVYAVIYGFGYAGVMTAILVTVRNLAAPARRASSMGIVLAFGYMGHGLGGWQGGFFYDLTSAYTWTYANAVISGFINLAIVGALWWMVTRRAQPSMA
jgi:MFS family permease